MATNCKIGLKKGNSVKYIYCHYDGYPDGVGKVLYENYKDEKTITKLLELGNLSSLGRKPIMDKDMLDYEERIWLLDTDPETYKDLSFVISDKPRDRAKTISSIDYNINNDDVNEEYMYLFEDGKWLIASVYYNDDFIPLEKVLTKNKEKEDVDTL